MAATLLLGALAPAAAGANSGKVTGKARGNLAAVSCPTATLCYAGGVDGEDHAVFDTLVNGRQTKSQKVHGLEELIGISCPTKSYCLMTGDTGTSVGAIETFSHGRFGKVTKLGFEAWQVSCPTAGRCVIAGFGVGTAPSLAAADVADGKVARVHQHRLGKPVTDTAIYGLSCTSMSACEMVGIADVTTSAGIGSVYAKVGVGGAISGVHVLQLSSDPSLENGIACAKSRCYVGAGTETQELLLSVPIGGAKLTRVAVLTMLPQYIACEHGLSVCVAAGVGTAGVPAIESFVKGQAQPEQDYPQLQSSDPLVSFADVAMPSKTRFVAIATEALSNSTQIVTGTP